MEDGGAGKREMSTEKFPPLVSAPRKTFLSPSFSSLSKIVYKLDRLALKPAFQGL
jgi:hypothetical protein